MANSSKFPLIELILVLSAIVAISFVASIKGQVGTNELERTVHGVGAGGALYSIYKVYAIFKGKSPDDP